MIFPIHCIERSGNFIWRKSSCIPNDTCTQSNWQKKNKPHTNTYNDTVHKMKHRKFNSQQKSKQTLHHCVATNEMRLANHHHCCSYDSYNNSITNLWLVCIKSFQDFSPAEKKKKENQKHYRNIRTYKYMWCRKMITCMLLLNVQRVKIKYCNHKSYLKKNLNWKT